MSVAHLSALSTEVLWVIAEVAPIHSLGALVQTNRFFFHQLNEKLYEKDARHHYSYALRWAVFHDELPTVERALAAGADANVLVPANMSADDPNYKRHAHLTKLFILKIELDAGNSLVARYLMKESAFVVLPQIPESRRAPISRGFTTSIRKLAKLAKSKKIISSGFLPSDNEKDIPVEVGCSFVEMNYCIKRCVGDRQWYQSATITPLKMAVRMHRLHILKAFLASTTVDMTERDGFGYTVLDWAARGSPASQSGSASERIFAMLVDSGKFNVNHRNKIGRKVFSLACKAKNMSVIRLLLGRANFDPHLPDRNQVNSLYDALPDMEILRMLIGFNVGTFSMDNLFRFACAKAALGEVGKDRWVAVMNKLAKSSLEIFPAVDGDDENLLHLAIRHNFRETINLLVKRHDIDINQQNYDGKTPLMACIDTRRTGTLDLLLRAGANCNIVDNQGWSALCYAVQAQKHQMVRKIVDYNGNINIVTHGRQTVLHIASQNERPALQFESRKPQYDYVSIFKLLLEKRAAPNAINDVGSTPLHVACRQGTLDMVKILIECGAKLAATTPTGATPLHEACRRDCVRHQLEIVQLLLEKGANVNAAMHNGHNALHVALISRCRGLVKTLMDHDADALAAFTETDTGRRITAVHLAARAPGTTADIEWLCSKISASRVSSWERGWTPLHEATHNLNYRAVCLLLECRANPGAVAENGRTPLHEVMGSPLLQYARMENTAILIVRKLLGTRRVDVNIKDNAGDTPAGVCRPSLPALQRLLSSVGADWV